MPLPLPPSHIHIIGIGGAGMSAIARILIGQGYRVSGSDRAASPLSEALIALGVTVHIGHDDAHIAGADAVIATSAVKPDHVEITAARESGIPVYKRQDIMADLMRGKRVIAVAGTHGKTTTTSMIAHILVETGRDPSYIIGGVLTTTGVNAAVGSGDAFVIEADEYDYMFLGLNPDIAVVTSVEWDHPDFFKTPQALTRAFEEFVERVTPDTGTLIVYDDDEAGSALAQHALSRSRGMTLTYGFNEKLMTAGNMQVNGDKTTFVIWASGAQNNPVPVTLYVLTS